MDRTPVPIDQRPERTVRIEVEHVPGVSTLVGRPGHGGFAWAARFANRADAIVALLRRALAVESDEARQ